jgi:positive regulator of sigma E activity
MKPTIPETGSVISLHGDTATVLLRGGGYCKGCGAGKIGLCRPGGRSMRLSAKNTAGARVGDIVVVGIDRETRLRGYLLAYIVPLLFFIAGTVFGHIAGGYLSIPSLEVPAGFLMLALTYLVTLRRLRLLDKSSAMTINKIVSDDVFEIDVKSDEQMRFEQYLIRR